MVVKSLSDIALLRTKRDVLRVHLYFKMVQFGIKPFENDLDIIIELYEFGGYTNTEQQSRFISLCLEKGLRKSAQSVRNALSKYVNIGVFEKPKNAVLRLSDRFIPQVKADKIVLEHRISHAE